MQTSIRAKRQSAWHMLASEYGDSTLNEQGSGEFDPLFVITKLGAKVNRLVVAGLLERLEPRETNSGATIWQGQIRDPSGIHYFSVGDYAAESMRELTLQLAARTDDGETLMIMMTAKAKFFQNEEGAVYTSLRPEEAAIIPGSAYRQWLVKASNDMLERMDYQQKSLSLEKTVEALAKEGIPEHLRSGLLLANAHYGEIDLESYRLNIMQALDIAEGKAYSAPPKQTTVVDNSQEKLEENDSPGEETKEESDDLKKIMMDLIAKLDQGEGVDFNSLLSNAAARGHDRDLAEEALDELSAEGSVFEQRFGWFKQTS